MSQNLESEQELKEHIEQKHESENDMKCMIFTKEYNVKNALQIILKRFII